MSRIYPLEGWREQWVLKRLMEHFFGAGFPLRYALMVVLMRLGGPESYNDKARWLARLLIPPRDLWGAIPRGLQRVFLGRTV